MTAILLEGVSKRYRQVQEKGKLSARLAALGRERRFKELWALRDVNLRCERGETLGIIGRNGSGKTTLLRLLAGVSAPTLGRLRIEGSVAPLIGVGVGFDGELTGLENVVLNAQILGMSPRKVAARCEEIVEFAEMEDFVDTPVKSYSSGMFLRLAFSVAVHVEPDILLVDEVLAVGDAAFQVKCTERMQQIRERGTTIVVVTHNLSVLNRMCERAVLLSRGAAVFDGHVEDAIGAYHEVLNEERVATDRRGLVFEEGRTQPFAGGAHVSARLVDPEGKPVRQVRTGQDFSVKVSATFDDVVEDPTMGVYFGVVGGGTAYVTHTMPGDHLRTYGPDHPFEAEITLRNRLLHGSYSMVVTMCDADGEAILGSSHPEVFAVTTLHRAGGVADLEGEFHIGGDTIPVAQHRRLGRF